MRILGFLFFSWTFLSASVYCQLGFEYDASIPVFKSGIQMQNPWAGGINYAQVSDLDFDFDGDMDLFIFDRSSNNIRIYIHENDGSGPYYRFEYAAENLFPDDIRYRAALVDYDGDGKKDLFSAGVGGMKVHRNIGNATDGLQWEVAKELLYTQYPSIYTNLYVSSSDIPAIVDVDLDGDIDILTFSLSGNHVEYHQNQSMDNYGVPDSLEFVLMNECWGKFTEDPNNNNIILNDPNAPCVGGNISDPESVDPLVGQRSVRHVGATLLALDYDNSGVQDLIIGDVSYTNLNLLINGGTAVNTDSPMISVDANFPSNTTGVDMEIFPAAFYVDVDFDNVKDLVVCPNAKNISENESSVMFYKNSGTNTNPNFIFQTPNYLQADMIEHGTGSIPVIVDIDEDGLEDLLVANLYRFLTGTQKETTIAYYKNTGTASNPEFTYIDYNYLNLNQSGFGFRLIPTFGDLDGDGDKDMLLGKEDGTLVYSENESVGNGCVFNTFQPNYTDNLGNIISVTNYSSPQLFDLNGDNLLDLIIGNKNGKIYYYENIGSSSVPSFELKNNNLGLVDVSGTSNGFAVPHFIRMDDTLHLLVGSENGTIYYYDSINNNLDTNQEFNLLDTKFLSLDVQQYAAPFTADLDGDSFLDLFVGQDLGGVYHFEVDTNSDASIYELSLIDFAIFPNPAETFFNVKFSEKVIGTLAIYDIQGKEYLARSIQSDHIQLSTESLSSGFYFVKFADQNGRVGLKKIIVK